MKPGKSSGGRSPHSTGAEGQSAGAGVQPTPEGWRSHPELGLRGHEERPPQQRAARVGITQRRVGEFKKINRYVPYFSNGQCLELIFSGPLSLVVKSTN